MRTDKPEVYSLLAFVVSVLVASDAVAEHARGFAVETDPVLTMSRAPAFRATVTTTAQDPPAVEASLGLDRPTRRVIQQGLRNEGFDPGAPDGLFGPRTRGALRRWQEARGMPPTGYLDSTQAERLRAAGTPERVAVGERSSPGAAHEESSGSVAPASASCEGSDTGAFFETATAEGVRACLAAGLDPQAPNDAGMTPLHWAAWHNENPAVVGALIDLGADLEARTTGRWTVPHSSGAPANPIASEREVGGASYTPLSLAAWNNANPAVVGALLEAGANPWWTSAHSQTLLHVAAQHNGSSAMIRALLRIGHDVAARDNYGSTPLHLAGGSAENPAVIDALLAADADVEAIRTNSNDSTPLNSAAENNANVAVVEALLAGGAKSTLSIVFGAAQRNASPVVLETLMEAAGVAATVTVLGGSLLHSAAENPNAAITEWLLASGAGDLVSLRDSNARTPLHEAAYWAPAATVKALLAAGADTAARESRGWTPLHWAAYSSVQHSNSPVQRSNAVVQVLLDAGADPAAQSLVGETPLHVVRNAETVKTLLSAGARVDAEDDDGDTPLHSTFSGAVVEALLAGGADPDARNNDGDTPLHSGVTPNKVVKLVAAGANPNARNNDEETPLHSSLNDPEDIEALVAVGANANARDSRGRTPMHFLRTAEQVEALFAAGGSLEARDQQGRTALHSAARLPVEPEADRYADSSSISRGFFRSRTAARQSLIRALVAAGANLEARDEDGNTPLHLAATYYYSDPDGILPHFGHAIEALLDAGANANARNANGRTPWDLAEGNEAVQGSDGYWRLNDARFNTPRQDSRRRSPGTPPDRRQATAPRSSRNEARACEISGYPTPANFQTLGLNWCSSNVDIQVRAFALQAAGAWCAIAEGTSSTPEQIVARHQEINAACDALDALGNRGGPPCRCPTGYRP